MLDVICTQQQAYLHHCTIADYMRLFAMWLATRTALCAASPQGRLGGGEGVEGLYGSITCSGMQRIVAALETHCRMGAGSCLVDVGAGLGRYCAITC